MKTVTIATISLACLVSGCAMLSTTEAQTTVSMFRQARNNGDLKAMHNAITRLAESGILTKGMTTDQVKMILGQPDNATGIYCPGGSSIGYGPKKPSVNNYGEFYWVHFRSKDYMTDKQMYSPPVLLSWD